MPRLRVLVLGGVDPGGGAGITADARVLELHGCHPLAVATCLTVQNRFAFTAVRPVEIELLLASLRAAIEDGPLHAVKLGLFAEPRALVAVAEVLAEHGWPVVIDPVLSATAGGYAATDAMVQAYRVVAPRLRAVVSPNRPELQRLAPHGGAEELLALGCAAVVAKDGHGTDSEVADRVLTPAGSTVIKHPRANCGAVHGTGCAFAAALAAGLAHRRDVTAAAIAATLWVGSCLLAMGPATASVPRPFEPRPDGPST